MQKLKSFFIVVLFFFGLITLVSLLMPSRVITTHTVMINSSIDSVFNYLRDLHKWKEWHPLIMNNNAEVKGQAGMPGSSLEWHDQKNRHNKLTVIRSDNRQLMFNQSREGENPIVNDLRLHSFEGRNDIQVEWIAIHNLKWYPWEKFSGIFLDKMSAPGYVMALDSLKSKFE